MTHHDAPIAPRRPPFAASRAVLLRAAPRPRALPPARRSVYYILYNLRYARPREGRGRGGRDPTILVIIIFRRRSEL